MQAHIPSLFPLHSLLTLTSVIPLHFRSFPCFFVNLSFVLSGTLRNLNSSSLILLSHACPLPLLSVVPQSSGATEADKGTCTCLFPSPVALPSQKPASAWRRLRCGWQCCSWFFFGSNHSQRVDLVFYSLTLFFTSATWMPPTPHNTFDQICTICLWRELNWLAGVLLFNFPSQCKWFDQAPALMEVALQS